MHKEIMRAKADAEAAFLFLTRVRHMDHCRAERLLIAELDNQTEQEIINGQPPHRAGLLRRFPLDP